MKYNIRLIIDKLEIEKVLRLRYEVFVLEQGDNRYSNQDMKTFGDEIDLDNPVLFGAFKESELIGTLRLVVREKTIPMGDIYYGWEFLAQQCDVTVTDLMKKVGILDRGVVKNGARRNGVMKSLIARACADALESNVKWLVAVCAENNQTTVQLLESLGFCHYLDIQGSGGWQAKHYFLKL